MVWKSRRPIYNLLIFPDSRRLIRTLTTTRTPSSGRRDTQPEENSMATRTAISFVLTGQPLTWNQAYTISLTTTGSLWKFTESAEATRQMMRDMAEASPRNNLDEDLFWVGANRQGSSWVWTDGTTVAPSYFDPQGVNADNDPSNDSASVAYNSILRDPNRPDQSPITAFILEYFGNLSTGTQYADLFVAGGAGPGQTVKMLGGDDFYIDSSDYFPNISSGGTVDGGSGNDVIAIYDGTSTAIDGEGQDIIEVYNGQIKASADGDNDIFFAPKVTYETAKIGMVVNGSIVSSSEIGTDEIPGGPNGYGAGLLYTGEGADTVVRWDGTKVYTRGGDDRIFVGSESGGARWADGGVGDDTIVAGHGGGTLIGGHGDDKLSLFQWDGNGKVEMTGGSGSDRFEFGTLQASTNLRPIINDFSAKSAVQDTLDLTAFDLAATSVADAFGKGLLSMNNSKGYTYLTVEGGNISADLTLMLKGTFGADIHDNIWI